MVRQHWFVVGFDAQKFVAYGLKNRLRDGGMLAEVIQLLSEVFEGCTVARTTAETNVLISRRLACSNSKNLVDSARRFVDLGFVRTNLVLSDHCLAS